MSVDDDHGPLVHQLLDYKYGGLMSVLFSNHMSPTHEDEIVEKLPDVYYINLAHREDRNAHILEQLGNIDYPSSRIHRIDAIPHEDGATGCGLSHIKALELAQKDHANDNDFVLVLEDDFTWLHDKRKTLNTLGRAFEHENWNVILLSCNGRTRKYNAHLSRVRDCQTTSAYIVRIGYIPNLLEIWKRDMQHRESSKRYEGKTCIDISWKRLQRNQWFLTKPKLGYQIASYSDIEKGQVDYRV